MRAGPVTLAVAIAGLCLLSDGLSAQVVQITPDQAALRVAEGPGSLRRAFAAEGVRVPPKMGTPGTVVFGAERWLRHLGFTPE